MADHGPYIHHVHLLNLLDGQDKRILAGKEARETIRAQVKNGKIKLARLERQLKVDDQAVADAESIVRANERSLADLERRIERTAKMEKVTTQKEFEAAEAALVSLKSQKETVEDTILNTMMELDNLRPAAEETRAALTVWKPAYARLRAEAKTEFDGHGQDIKAASEERAGYLSELADLGQGVLEHYELIMRRHGDRALTVAVNETCLFCHISVSVQHLLEVRLGKVLHECDNCGRIVMPAGPAS